MSDREHRRLRSFCWPRPVEWATSAISEAGFLPPVLALCSRVLLEAMSIPGVERRAARTGRVFVLGVGQDYAIAVANYRGGLGQVETVVRWQVEPILAHRLSSGLLFDKVALTGRVFFLPKGAATRLLERDTPS